MSLHPRLIKGAERLGRWHIARQVHDPHAPGQPADFILEGAAS